MVELSVVIPVYGCGECLRALHARLRKALAGLAAPYELVFVDDRSPDGAWPVLRALAAEDPAVRVLRLSRNFGQHAAITAGLAQSRGAWTVVMDCDLQDPPEEIPRLLAKAREGYDVVLSRRHKRRQPVLRRIAAVSYFRLRRALVKGELDNNMTNLSILSRKVVDAFLSLRDRDRQYLLMIEWLGFRRATIEVRQSDRHAGRSAYSLEALLRVAVDGLFFESTALLRWVVYAGFCLAGLGVLLALYALVAFLAGGSLPQWTALPMLILVLTGFIIISTGVTGLYVGKIFDQVKGRPLYVVDTRIEGGEEHSAPEEAASRARAAGELPPLEPAGARRPAPEPEALAP